MRRHASVILAVALVTAAAPATVVAAKLTGGARYAGKTDEGTAVTLRLSKSGKLVARMRIAYHVTCDNGASGTPSTDVFDLKLGRSGGFSYRGSYIGRVDHSRNRVRLRGTVTARSAHGTFALTAVGTPSGSTSKVRCRSRTVSWSAAAQR